MAILHLEPARRPRRRAALIAGTALVLGAAFVWLIQPGAVVVPAIAHAPPTVTAPPGVAMATTPAVEACDARCATAKVIVPATTACAAAVEELASFGVRWLDGDASSPKFDRFAWLQPARGTVTLAGNRVEFRNAAGAARPVDYECDFDPASLAVLAARARPQALAAVATAQPVER